MQSRFGHPQTLVNVTLALAAAFCALILVLPAFASSDALRENEPPRIDNSVHGVWYPLDPPPGRTEHTAVYDNTGRRMVVFGGRFGSLRLDDTWTLSLADTMWTRLYPAGDPPSGRSAHTAIYDPVRNRMIVFGGDDGASQSDVWSLSLGDTPGWTPLTPTGVPPPPRWEHTTVYDPVRDQLVLFGGRQDNAPYVLNDVWTLSLQLGNETWTQVFPVGPLPSGRGGHTMIYDSVSDRIVIFGGWNGFGDVNDTWALSLGGTSTWSQMFPTGAAPAPREHATAIFDAANNAMIMFGGIASGGNQNDVWSLSFTATDWTQLLPTGNLPSPTYSHTAIIDPIDDHMIVYGGSMNELSSLSLSGSPEWSRLIDSAPPPSVQQHSIVYDSARDQLIAFGGWSGACFNETWMLPLSDNSGWTPLAPIGTLPTPKYGHVTIYDPVRDRVIVHGGFECGVGGSYDTWALSLSPVPEWNQLFPTGTPNNGGTNLAAVYDPVRDRMLVYGGGNSDVWQLPLSGTLAWSVLPTAGTRPAIESDCSTIYDPIRDCVIIFGGRTPISNETWALSLSGTPGWEELTTVGPPPPARYAHSAVYDPVLDRMVAFGGNSGGTLLNDSWALSLSGAPEWTELIPAGELPDARWYHTSAYDPVRDRMIVHGGSGVATLSDTWALTWNSRVSIKVTVQVRENHDDGPFLPVPPPLEGVSVRLVLDGGPLPIETTNANGIATFAARPEPGGVYEVLLRGPFYDVRMDGFTTPDIDPIKSLVPMSASGNVTSFMWSHGTGLASGPALQAAYFLERFRNDFLRDRLGYEWTVPSFVYGDTDNAVNVIIFERNPDLGGRGGAGPSNGFQDLLFLQHRSEESDVVYHEFTHSVIFDRFAHLGQYRAFLLEENDEGHALDEALADYFAASFTNDPVIARCAQLEWPFDPATCEPLRDISQVWRYPTVGGYSYNAHDGSRILSGALWDLRRLVDGENTEDARNTDALVFAAIDMTIVTRSDPGASYLFSDFYDALKAVDQNNGGIHSTSIDEAFGLHNLGVNQQTYSPLRWLIDALSVELLTADQVTLAWTPLAGAVLYDLVATIVSYDPSGPSISSFVPIATSLADTVYVFEGRDAWTDYLFSVVPVDSSGQGGYLAQPVSVPPLEDPTDTEMDAYPPHAVQPHGHWLYNSPNPFNPSTRFVFDLRNEDSVMITVYDIRGRKVRALGTKRYGAGRNVVEWTGIDDRGNTLSSGVYIVVLQGSEWRDQGRALLLK